MWVFQEFHSFYSLNNSISAPCLPESTVPLSIGVPQKSTLLVTYSLNGLPSTHLLTPLSDQSIDHVCGEILKLTPLTWTPSSQVSQALASTIPLFPHNLSPRGQVSCTQGQPACVAAAHQGAWAQGSSRPQAGPLALPWVQPTHMSVVHYLALHIKICG